MNSTFLKVLNAPKSDQKGLFLSAANRLGAPLQNIEKDFWICLVLDLLFNGRQGDEPRLLFKGGTSLSKAYSVISRFSEDLDITVFREDINQHVEVDALEQLSGKQQRKHLEKIKIACQNYIHYHLKPHLENQLTTIFSHLSDQLIIEIDQSDNSHQTLLVRYPSIDAMNYGYIKPVVKIECGARSALDPHTLTTIKPYIAHEMCDDNFDVNNVVTINGERTFWDKVIILHGIRRGYDLKGELRQNGHRFSRHYYDVYQLLNSKIGLNAKMDLSLAMDCVRHAKMFFNSNSLDLESARPGSFSLLPTDEMQNILKRDYKAMQEMIFGDVPDFSKVLESIAVLQNELNG